MISFLITHRTACSANYRYNIAFPQVDFLMFALQRHYTAATNMKYGMAEQIMIQGCGLRTIKL